MAGNGGAARRAPGRRQRTIQSVQKRGRRAHTRIARRPPGAGPAWIKSRSSSGSGYRRLLLEIRNAVGSKKITVGKFFAYNGRTKVDCKKHQ